MADVPKAPFSRAVSAAGALFFDERGRVLLLEPTYKDYWDIPGGYVEEGETPVQACVREVEEELGLHITPGRSLVIDWAPSPTEGAKILFVFDGGVLRAERLAEIKLADGEIASYEFVAAPAVAEERLIPRLARRVAAAVRACDAGTTSYLEHGLVVGQA
jgi:8-oxo-dGTP diphosphatase